MFLLKKLLSLFLTISFFIVTVIPQGITATDIIGAFQGAQNTPLEILSDVPKEIGKLFETNIKEKSVPDIILIYDMHCQPYTQNNMMSGTDFSFMFVSKSLPISLGTSDNISNGVFCAP